MNVIKELWHGNIVPHDYSRNNSPEMKELMEYMTRHHDDLLKSMTDEQKEIFEKFDVASQKQLSVVFDAAKPPKATSRQSRASAGDKRRLCDGGEKLERVYEPRRSSYLRVCFQIRCADDARDN